MGIETIEISEWICLVLLGGNAVQDVRKREILLWPTLAAAGIGILWMLIGERAKILPVAASAAPGLILFSLAGATAGEIGAGDGLALIAAGIWSGLTQILYIAAGGLFLAAMAAGVLMITRSRIRRIPLVPFFLAAQIGCLFLQHV